MNFQNLTDSQLIKCYKDSQESPLGKEAEEYLLAKYKKDIKGYADTFYFKNKNAACQADFFQEASLAALAAIKNFNPKSTNTFRTYLCRTMDLSLRTFLSQRCNKIKVTSRNVAIRNYFTGYYDNYPEKKKKIEAALKLYTQEDIDRAFNKYKSLFTNVESLDAIRANKNGTSDMQGIYEVLIDEDYESNTQKQIENKAIIKQFMRKLDGKQKKIFTMFHGEGFTKKEIAEILQEDETIIRNELRTLERMSKKFAQEVERSVESV